MIAIPASRDSSPQKNSKNCA